MSPQGVARGKLVLDLCSGIFRTSEACIRMSKGWCFIKFEIDANYIILSISAVVESSHCNLVSEQLVGCF